VSASREGWQLARTGPEAYERYLVPAIFAPFAERLLELAAPGPGTRVLDVACGTGIVARRAAVRVGAGGTVMGVDSNASMLEIARAASREIAPPIRWLAADAADLPLPDASADCVLCQQGLQFLADRDAALREMCRVLAPGGRLALSVWCSLQANPGFAVLVEALERHVGRDVGAIMRAPFAGIDGDALRGLVASAGLRDDPHTHRGGALPVGAGAPAAPGGRLTAGCAVRSALR
jgi:SAM-dependent methyltransferase